MSRLETVRDRFSVHSPTAIVTLLVGVAMFSSGLLAAFVSRAPIVRVAYYGSAALVVTLCLVQVIGHARGGNAGPNSTDVANEGSQHK